MHLLSINGFFSKEAGTYILFSVFFIQDQYGGHSYNRPGRKSSLQLARERAATAQPPTTTTVSTGTLAK